MRTRGAGNDGFTLIEALVAFAIVAAATVVVQRSLVQSRSAVGRTAERVAPEWVARSLLAEPLSEVDLAEGGRTGLANGRRFAIRLTPLVDGSKTVATPTPDRPQTPAEKRFRWLPVRMSISVETDRAKWLTVETVKLARTVTATTSARAE